MVSWPQSNRRDCSCHADGDFSRLGKNEGLRAASKHRKHLRKTGNVEDATAHRAEAGQGQGPPGVSASCGLPAQPQAGAAQVNRRPQGPAPRTRSDGQCFLQILFGFMRPIRVKPALETDPDDALKTLSFDLHQTALSFPETRGSRPQRGRASKPGHASSTVPNTGITW